MKKFLTLTIIALFALIVMATNVQAAEVSTWEAVKSELATGSEDTVTFTGAATITGTETLDLNGKTLILKNSLVIKGGSLTITGKGTISSEETYDLIIVKEKSTLIVENGTLKATANDNGVVRVEGSATETTEKTTVTIKKDAELIGNYCIYMSKPAVKNGSHYGAVINVYGKLTGITENNGYNEGSIGISVNGEIKSITGNIPTINIYEGAVIETAEGTTNNINKDNAPAIYAAGYANWNIYGGTIKGSEALSIKAGKFNITGGTFIGNGKYVNPAVANNDGTEATGSAISITANDGYAKNVELNITNAEVSSKNGYAISESTTKGTGTAISKINISGGNFIGNEDLGAVLISNTAEVGKFITGGTFSSDIKSYTSDTLTSVEEDGVFYVGTLNKITVEETQNGKVEASLKEAVVGQTITLTVTPEEGYKLATLKVNDKDVVDGKFVMPDEDVTVKATFEKIVVENEKDETPDTGIETATTVFAVVALISLAGLVLIRRKK